MQGAGLQPCSVLAPRRRSPLTSPSPLRAQVRWETNVKNGVCGLSFDRRDIEMNKFVATCLESQFHVFDARTQHTKKVGPVAAVCGNASIQSSAGCPHARVCTAGGVRGWQCGRGPELCRLSGLPDPHPTASLPPVLHTAGLCQPERAGGEGFHHLGRAPLAPEPRRVRHHCGRWVPLPL